MSNWNGLERRQFPRVNYPCLITIRHEASGLDAFLTHTENIGTGGVCLLFKREFKLFSEADLEIDLLDMEKNIKCRGKVVWSVKVQPKKPEKRSSLIRELNLLTSFRKIKNVLLML